MTIRRSHDDILGIYNATMGHRLGYALFGRFLPALLFALILTAKAQTVLSLVVAGPAALPPPTYFGHLAYQSLTILFLATICLLFVLRQPIVRGLGSLADGLLGIGGTFITTLLFVAPVTNDGAFWLLGADALMVAGSALSLVALVHLGRCFGISPQARGLVTSGPYRWARHPLYVSEEITTLGLLLPVLSPVTLAIFLIQVALQFCRARAEERVLSAAFASYDNYRKQVARFIPGLY